MERSSGPAVHGPAIGQLKGKDQVEAAYREMVGGFPDMEFEQHRLLLDGHRAVAVLTFRGTHEGEFAGIPGTGKRISFDVLVAIRFEGTSIAGLRFFYDFNAAKMKTGAFKVKPV
ncbi:MAG: ester cyclase [Vicinamibacterales bacterium]|nr:hypothetical protein [Acidobacteriota bacterium]MDP6373720.1 ester cyclase [Vicinamibacterales bacterium]MDP6609102.1 ester cyclase [Vicinamibacterales bacterium]HAK55711.1 hypothetical protein [Acidobacteriota bacterium]